MLTFIRVRLGIIPPNVIRAAQRAAIAVLAFLAKDVAFFVAFVQLDIDTAENSTASFVAAGWTTLVL